MKQSEIDGGTEVELPRDFHRAQLTVQRPHAVCAVRDAERRQHEQGDEQPQAPYPYASRRVTLLLCSHEGGSGAAPNCASAR